MSSDIQLYLGNCLEVMRTFPDNSIDTVITDPPAGIAFMGKEWDSDKGGSAQWIAWLTEIMAECLRVTKPGGMALVWSIPRTSHWTGMAVEQAGWIPRDVITHLFGTGFPKSHNISAAIDRATGATGTFGDYKTPDHAAKRKKGSERLHEGWQRPWMEDDEHRDRNNRQYIAATDAARQWDGWGTALKPAAEFWWLAMKPLDTSRWIVELTPELLDQWEAGQRDHE